MSTHSRTSLNLRSERNGRNGPWEHVLRGQQFSARVGVSLQSLSNISSIPNTHWKGILGKQHLVRPDPWRPKMASPQLSGESGMWGRDWSKGMASDSIKAKGLGTGIVWCVCLQDSVQAVTTSQCPGTKGSMTLTQATTPQMEQGWGAASGSE